MAPNRLLGWLAVLALGLPACHASGGEPPPSRPMPAAPVIPFSLRDGRMLVTGTAPDSRPLTFLLDTGYTMTMLNAEVARSLHLRKVGQVTIEGIAGDEEADEFEGPALNFGGALYTPRSIGSLPERSRSHRRGRDGILGSGFFRRHVVEVDPQTRTLRLHDPGKYTYSGAGEVIPLQFADTTPSIAASIRIPGREPADGRFEIDTGCDGGLCLGSDFVKRHQLAQAVGETRGGFRSGVGGGARTRSGRVPQLQLGRLKVEQPQANFFLDGSPVDDGLAGHIGMDVLRHFKIIFDYAHRRMILEPIPKQ